MASANPEPEPPLNEVEANRVKHQEAFERWLNDLKKDKNTSYVVDRAKEEKIKRYLNKSEPKPDPNFTHYIKKAQLSVPQGESVLHRLHKGEWTWSDQYK